MPSCCRCASASPPNNSARSNSASPTKRSDSPPTCSGRSTPTRPAASSSSACNSSPTPTPPPPISPAACTTRATSTTSTSSTSRRRFRRSKIDVTQARAQTLGDREAVNRLLGLDGAQASAWTAARSLPPIPGREPSAGALETRAVSQRLDLQAARATLAAAEQRAGVARGHALLARRGVGRRGHRARTRGRTHHRPDARPRTADLQPGPGRDRHPQGARPPGPAAVGGEDDRRAFGGARRPRAGRRQPRTGAFPSATPSCPNASRCSHSRSSSTTACSRALTTCSPPRPPRPPPSVRTSRRGAITGSPGRIWSVRWAGSCGNAEICRRGKIVPPATIWVFLSTARRRRYSLWPASRSCRIGVRVSLPFSDGGQSYA